MQSESGRVEESAGRKKTIQINSEAYLALLARKADLEREKCRVFSLAEVVDSVLGIA